MKLLFTILIVYFAYKLLFREKRIDPPYDKNPKVNKRQNEGEYIDYEEIDQE